MRSSKLCFVSAVIGLGPHVGCGGAAPEAPPEFDVQIRVHGDPGEPLAGAKVLFQNQPVGMTDRQGLAHLRLQGVEGQSFALALSCPEGYQSPTKPIEVTLRKILEQAKAPEYEVQCPPSLRTVVVAVRADLGADLPVTYLGQEVARTDSSGAAHVLLRVPPHQAVQLTLDTTKAAALQPQNPTGTFDVKDRDDVFVFDPGFKKKTVRARGVAKPSGPTPL